MIRNALQQKKNNNNNREKEWLGTCKAGSGSLETGNLKKPLERRHEESCNNILRNMHAADSMPLRLYCMFCNNCFMSNPSGMIGRELMLVAVQCPQRSKSGLDMKLHLLYAGHLGSFPNPTCTEIYRQ